MISRTSAYALEAAIIIAERQPERVRANELAAELGVPANYLSKILATMARAGLLESGRGPHGGFRLAADATDTMVGDVVGLFEDVSSTRRCLLGRGTCSDTNSCPAHDQWRAVSRPLFDFFDTTTLASLSTHRSRRPRKRTASR